MKFIKNAFLYILSIISIYLFTFNPVYLPFSSMGLIKCFYPLLLLFLFSGEYRHAYKRFMSISNLYLVAIAFCLFSTIISTSNSIYTRAVNFIEIFLLPVLFASFFLKHNLKLPSIIGWTATLASLISLFAFLNPAFLQILRSVQPIAESVDDYTLLVREFGFSSELYSGFGWSLGFITVYLLLNLKKESYFVFVFPLIFFAILINSRSGGLAVIIGIVVYVLFNRSYYAIIGISAFILLFFIIINYVNLEWINEGTMTFIGDFFNQLANIFKGNSENTYLAAYTGYQFVLPDNIIEWIFGRGFRLMGNKYGVASSDIGYLNDLAIGGIFYVLFVYRAYWKFFNLIKVRWFFIASVAIFIVLNIKGSALETNGLSRIFALIVFYETLSITSKKHENN